MLQGRSPQICEAAAVAAAAVLVVKIIMVVARAVLAEVSFQHLVQIHPVVPEVLAEIQVLMVKMVALV